MVTTPLAAPNDDVDLGSFIVDATELQVQAFLKMAAADNGVDFETIAGVAMTDTSVINTLGSRPNVRVNVDAQTLWALKTVMGFDNISSNSTPGGNVFINSSSSISAATVQTWLDADSYQTTGQRRTYIGIAKGGTGQTALVPGLTRAFDPDPLFGDNGFCPVSFKADDVHTAGYPASGYVFTYPATWFTLDTQANPNAHADATYQGGPGGVYHSPAEVEAVEEIERTAAIRSPGRIGAGEYLEPAQALQRRRCCTHLPPSGPLMIRVTAGYYQTRARSREARDDTLARPAGFEPAT